MDFSATSQISVIIQQAVAPVFLLAGIGAFVNAFANRLARTFDRSRFIEAQIDGASPEKKDLLRGDLTALRRRAHLAYIGIALGTLAALLVCVLIAVSFTGYFFDIERLDKIVHDFTAGLFLAAMLSLIGGLVSFLREISIAVKGLSIGRE
jgi:hypothetical protein